MFTVNILGKTNNEELLEHEIRRNYIRGVIYIILATFSFATMSLFIKLMGPVPVMQKTLFRSFIQLLVAIAVFKKSKKTFKINSLKGVKLLIVRSLLGTIGIALNYYSVDNLILSDANIIQRMATIFLVVSCWLFLGDKLKRVHITTFMISFVGVMFVVKPTFSVQVIPYLISLFGSVCIAASYTALRALRNYEDPVVIIIFFSAFSVLFTIPFVYIQHVDMSMMQWIYGILAGCFAALGQIGVTNAYRFAQAKKIGIFEYLSILIWGFYGMIFFGEFPDVLSIIGYFIIFIAGLYLHIYNKNHIETD